MSGSIDQFKSLINKLRDILRLNAITGMNSMRHICLYLTSRFITIENAKRLKLDEKHAWENIYKFSAVLENGNDARAIQAFKDFIDMLDDNFQTNKFSYDIKNEQTHKEIMLAVNTIDMIEISNHLDILGYVFEDCLATGGSNARDLGQFYTDRTLINYLINVCEPKIKANGEIETICDPTCGTGGFLTAFMNIMNKTHENIDWTTEQNKIFGCDIDQQVSALTRLNLFMGSHGNIFKNIRNDDSLHRDVFTQKFDIITANMPFGLKGIKYVNCCQTIQNLKIKGTKSEPLFLQLIMALLEKYGRAAVIVPDGVLLNTDIISTKTREYLIKNFNLKKIIKTKSDFFINTKIQPSILVFENSDKKTEIIQYIEIIKDLKNNEIVETYIGDILIADLDKKFTLEFVVKKEIVPIVSGNFELFKLIDICTVNFGTRITQKDNTGELYAVYGSGNESFKTDNFNRDGINCKVGRFACSENTMVQIIEGKYWQLDSGFTVISKLDNVIDKYLWYTLLINKSILFQCIKGTCQKNIEMDKFYNLEFKFPPVNTQQKIIESLDGIFDNIEKCKYLINSNKECMKFIINSVKSDNLIKLNDVCDYKNGKTLKSTDKIEDGEYEVMGGGTNYMGKYNQFNCEGNNITVSKSGTAGFVKLHENKRFWAGDCFTIFPKDDRLLFKYLYYYLKLTNLTTEDIKIVVTIPHCKFDDIKDKSIQLPSTDMQQIIIEKLDKINNHIQILEESIIDAENNAKFVLSNYLE
jgi:restriction endonuclease S subunit